MRAISRSTSSSGLGARGRGGDGFALLDAVSARVLAIEERTLRSYPGGWAEYSSRREAEPQPKPKPPKPRKERPAPGRPAGPTPIELVEREIARTEKRIADLERQLADDWTNVDLVNAHRAARDELAALLSRWEGLFEEAQAER